MNNYVQERTTEARKCLDKFDTIGNPGNLKRWAFIIEPPPMHLYFFIISFLILNLHSVTPCPFQQGNYAYANASVDDIYYMWMFYVDGLMTLNEAVYYQDSDCCCTTSLSGSWSFSSSTNQLSVTFSSCSIPFNSMRCCICQSTPWKQVYTISFPQSCNGSVVVLSDSSGTSQWSRTWHTSLGGCAKKSWLQWGPIPKQVSILILCLVGAILFCIFCIFISKKCKDYDGCDSCCNYCRAKPEYKPLKSTPILPRYTYNSTLARTPTVPKTPSPAPSPPVVVYRCSCCGGSGSKTCPDCDGSAFVLLTTAREGVKIDCPSCGGSGYVKCSAC